jgi:fructose-1-phosphate kinase PfkB-like protein
VWALAQGQSLAEALRWGVACGAATAASPGTSVGERAAVERLHAQTSVQALAGALA